MYKFYGKVHVKYFYKYRNELVDLTMTAPQLQVEDFLLESKNNLIIDVRSPEEFFKGHIIGSINVPLFENEERAEIGTLYKQQGKEKAINRGLEIVKPKKPKFIERINQLTLNKSVFVYCFRGGMRSNSFAWFLNSFGYDAKILKGGYKAFRNFVLSEFNKHRKIILLGGKTGSKKTELLNQLKNEGYPILNIEEIANHKGSAFGSINQNKQEPQQTFENKLFQELQSSNNQNYLIIEDESQTLGYNKIPHAFWLQMKNAPIIKINLELKERLNQLVKEYATIDKQLLINAVNKIAQQLGPLNTKQCINYIQENQLHAAAEICLHYYDRAYEYKYEKKTDIEIIELNMCKEESENNFEQVKQIINKLSKHVG
jgi:tRNA 2-selenouridine synthase